MKAVKNVLSAVAVIALLAVIFSAPPARADGLHGVTETAKEILIDVPRFCRPLKTVWTVRWEENTDNKGVMLSFTRKEKGAKIVVSYLRPGAVKLHALWRGGETVHIPKFDTKGKPIKVKLVSILALGDESGLPSDDNWLYESQNSRWVDGAIASPPVSVGTWGKCT